MIRNYLTILVRSTTKNIVYVLINVICLGLAMAICIVAYLNFRFDADFDTNQEKRERIYRIEHSQLIEGEEISFASTPSLLGPSVVEDIIGVEKVARMSKDLLWTLVRAGENERYAGLYYVDADFFDIFTFPFISGNKESFRNNNSVIITERLAVELFGDKDPVGEIISVKDSPYAVGGVIKNHPLNSSFQFEAIAPIRALHKNNMRLQMKWGNIYEIASTFILVKDPKQVDAIVKSLQNYVPVVNDVNFHQVERFNLAPFENMAHRGRMVMNHPFQSSLHPAAVLPPLIAAICILLIACFNFTNTSIAHAGKRSKEIGMRKVLGSLKRQLFQQLMIENLLMVFFASIFTLFFAHYFVPAYSAMWDFMDISFSVSEDPELFIFMILTLFVTAIISGAYPSLFISNFNPVSILQNNLKLGAGNIISKGLLTLQFGITILALFTGVVFIQNTNYQRSFDPGYDGDYLYTVHGEHESLKIYKDAIISYPDIVNVSESFQGPFFNGRSIQYGETRLEAKMNFLEMKSFHTMGLRLLEGRPFETETESTDEIGSILVNRNFIEKFGMIEPVGKTVMMSDSIPLTIIGVIENLLNEGVFTTSISPIFYMLADDSYKTSALWIRVAPEKQEEIIQFLKLEWNRLVPDLPFFGVAGDVFMEASHYISRKILTITFSLVLIASLLSVAGLYSQISLRIILRAKEIGIRKVFGASILTVIKTLNYEFLVIFSIGSIGGMLAGYYLNMALMDSIWEYFTDQTVYTFIIPLLSIFVVSVITVSGKVYYAATRNPAHSLRHD